jgi:hypothetical protein
MADGRFPKREYRGRSPPRNDRFANDRRPNWSPPRNRRRDDFDRGRDYNNNNNNNWDRFGRDVERRKPVFKDWKLDGALLSESQFNEAPQWKGIKYETYKTEHKRYNTKLFFLIHRTETRFMERYNPTSIVERRKRDAAESQLLAAQFLSKLEDESFELPNYDADLHADLFPDFVMEPSEVIEIDEAKQEEKGEAMIEDNAESKEVNKEKRDEKKNVPQDQEKLKRAFLEKQPPLIPVYSNERIPKDLELAQKLTFHFDQMRSIPSNPLLSKSISLQTTQPTETTQSTEAQETETVTETKVPSEQELAEEEKNAEYYKKFTTYSEKQQLDLLIYYLKTVHFHVYYTCTTFPALDKEKAVLCYRGSEKLNRDAERPIEAAAWGENVDKKIQDRLTIDLRVASGERKCEEYLEAFYNEKIVKDSAERFRCDVCSKMFKGPIFVKKHIAAKHPEKLEEIKEKALEEQYFQNYLQHCDKIQDMNQDREKLKNAEAKPRIDKDKDLRVRDTSTDLRRRSRSPPNRSDNKRPRSPPRKGGAWENEDRRQNPRGGRGQADSWGGRGSGIRGGRGKFARSDFQLEPEMREKMDPRARFVDLDKPQENAFEIDYEKALAAFEEGNDDDA